MFPNRPENSDLNSKKSSHAISPHHHDVASGLTGHGVNSQTQLAAFVYHLRPKESSWEDFVRVYLHPDFISELKRKEPHLVNFVRQYMPMTILLALCHTKSVRHHCPSLSEESVQQLCEVALQVVCGRTALEREGSTESNTANCGPLWDRTTTVEFFTVFRDLLVLTLSDIYAACDHFEVIIPSAKKAPLQAGPRTAETVPQLLETCCPQISPDSATLDLFSNSNPDEPPALPTETTILSAPADVQPHFIVELIHSVRWQAQQPVVRPTDDELASFVQEKSTVMQHALQLLEAVLVAVVRYGIHDPTTALGPDGLLSLGGSATDVPKMRFFDKFQSKKRTPGPSYDSADISHDDMNGGCSVDFTVQYAIQAFTHVFLSLTAVHQQQQSYRKEHTRHLCTGACQSPIRQYYDEEFSDSEGDVSESTQAHQEEETAQRGLCAACETFNRIEATVLLRLQSNLHALQYSAIAFVAHDPIIAESAIEYIDSRGPEFVAQATMLLAHVLTPDLMAAHPPNSRGGFSIQWIVGYVFGGLGSDDVERTQKEREEQLMRKDSNVFSIDNSSASSRSPLSSPPSSKGCDEDCNKVAFSAAELRVEYILASCFTRCHSLLTVIGVVAESDAYNCGLVVAQAVLQYAYTLALTSARLLRTPLLADTWSTPFTEAMMQRLNNLAMMDDDGGELLGSPDTPQSFALGTSEMSMGSSLEDCSTGEPSASTSPSASVHTCEHEGSDHPPGTLQPRWNRDGTRAPPPSMPELTRDYLKRKTKKSNPFQARPTAAVTGTTPSEMAESAINRTGRRCLALHWAKCVILSARRLVKCGVVKVTVPREHYHNLQQMSRRLQELINAAQEEGSPLVQPSTLESASSYQMNESKLTSEEIIGRGSRSPQTRGIQKESADALSPSDQGALLQPDYLSVELLNNNSIAASDLSSNKEHHHKAFVESFCNGNHALTFDTSTPFVAVPLHEVVFASIFKILESCGDVLLCEMPRLNSIFANELVSLIYELRLAMLEYQLRAFNDKELQTLLSGSNLTSSSFSHHTGSDSKNASATARVGKEYQVLFPVQYKIIVEEALRSNLISERWMKEVNANPGHPAAGYVSLLVHVQKRMENPGRTSIADFVLSRGTLRLLLGVSARDSLGGRGGVLHIDDLDVEGTKKEDVAPRLGVIASKDVVSGGEEHSSKVLSCEAGLRTGKIHDGGEAGTTDGTGFDTSSYSGTLTTGLAFSPEVSAVNRRTQPELPPQRERRKDMVRLVGCAADLQEIIARAPKSWQLPENVLETNEELREELKQMKGFQSQDAIAGSLPDAHTNPFPVPRLFSLRSPLHVQGTRPLGSEWTAKPLSLNTSMRHSFSWQRGGSLVRAISVPKELYSYDFHRKSKSRLNVSQRTKKTTERRPQEEKTQKVGGERFSYVRQLIESGAFGSPDGNKSFSFLRTDEETKPEMGSGLAESAPVPQQEEEAVIVDETPLPAPTELPPQPTLWKEQHLRVEQPKKLCLSPGSPLHMNTPTIHTSENKSGMSQRPPMTPSDRFAFPHSSSISPDEDDLST